MTRQLPGSMLLIAALIACGCSDSTTTTSPSATTTTPSTEQFSGTLSPSGSVFYSFTVNATGTVSVTLASTTTSRIGPATSAVLSLGLGIPSGFGCATTSSVEATAGLTAQLSSANSAAGIACVNVSDPGGLTGDLTFIVRIVHT